MATRNWVTISQYLHTAEAGIGGLAQVSSSQADATDTGRELDSSSMRSLHQWLREMDASFGVLERVNDRGRYKWIHQQFLPDYHDTPS